MSRPFDGGVVGFLGRQALLANKRAAGPPKDLLDVQILTAGSEPGEP